MNTVQYGSRSPGLSKTGKKWIIAGCIVAALFLSMFGMFENNKAGWICVRQSVFGDLDIVTKPGPFWQGFGSIEKYKQAVTIGFGSNGEESSADMPAIDVRFADSGKAAISGNARFEMPSEETEMLRIHTQYRSFEHLVDTLLEKATAQVTGLTAQMMTSEDTYTGGRGKFIEMCLDQLENGLYQTETREIESEDPITKEKRRIRVVTPRRNDKGELLRLENELGNYGIKVTQYIIDRDFKYENDVNEQIGKQRDALNKTNTARAEALQASQEAITAKAKGEAAIAEAKAKQMVEKETATVKAQKEAEVAKIDAEREATIAKIASEKEKAVATIDAEKAKIEATKAANVAQIEAEQRLKVAELEKQAAEQAAQALLLKAEAEAKGRKLVLEADGALTAKLETYARVQASWAQALSGYRGNLVPTVIMSGKDGASNNTQDFLSLLMAKAAKDLAINLTPTINTSK